MKVFISSLISGFGPMRQAAKRAVETLRHQPIMAEDFGAQPNSPQIACLQGLRQSDVVVLILGEGYGAIQPGTNLSATHEEYRDAQGRKPVIAFVQEGVTREPAESAFVAEVQRWEGGLFRGGFRDAEDLQTGITRALHDFELANAVGPLDPQALIERAVQLLPTNRNNNSSGTAMLNIAVVGGPLQQILRPVEIEDETLAEALHQEALFGVTRLFDRALGVTPEMKSGALVLEQERGARVELSEQGEIVVRVSLNPPAQNRSSSFGGLPVLIEENVSRQIGSVLAYSGWVLEHIDPTQRLTHVAIAAHIQGADHMAWRTQLEHDASPNSVSMGYGQEEPRTVHVSKTRAALRLDQNHLIEDLLVPLRRQWKSR